MASSIASLFGPSAEEIAYNRQEEDKLKKQQQLFNMASLQPVPEAQIGYLTGYQMGGALTGLFGDGPELKDPRIAQSIKSRQIMSDVNIEDLNDPGQIATLAQRFSEAGMPEAALYFKDRQNALETQQRDYQLELAKAAAKGATDPAALNTFLKQVDGQLGTHNKAIEDVDQARNLLNLSDLENNENAQKILNRLLIGLTRDSQIGMTELQNFVGGGSLGERISNDLSLFFTGDEAYEKSQNKEQILNVIEIYHKNKLQEKGSKLRQAFSPMITPSTVDLYTTNFNGLSNSAEKYLKGLEQEGPLGTINVQDILNQDLKYFE
jgi:hypothetical protein